MSSYTSKLKTWGAQGAEYPNSYNYIEGEQPVDDWDNFLTFNIIDDLQHLISLTDDRLESNSGSSHPTSPEPGHLSHRTDGVVTTDEEIFFYDNTNAAWHRLLQADGDTLSGVIDVGGYQIENSKGPVPIDGQATVNGSNIGKERYWKYEGGTVSSGEIVPIGTFNLANNATLKVTQASLTDDGFTTPCVSGVDLVIVPEGAIDSTDTVTILGGDGTTLYDERTGSPLAKYQNTSGAAQTVMIGIDNGGYNAGTGQNEQAFSGYIARKE